MLLLRAGLRQGPARPSDACPLRPKEGPPTPAPPSFHREALAKDEETQQDSRNDIAGSNPEMRDTRRIRSYNYSYI